MALAGACVLPACHALYVCEHVATASGSNGMAVRANTAGTVPASKQACLPGAWRKGHLRPMGCQLQLQ